MGDSLFFTVASALFTADLTSAGASLDILRRVSSTICSIWSVIGGFVTLEFLRKVSFFLLINKLEALRNDYDNDY